MEISDFEIHQRDFQDPRFGKIDVYQSTKDSEKLIFCKTTYSSNPESHLKRLELANERLNLKNPYLLKMLRLECDDKSWRLKSFFEYSGSDIRGQQDVLQEDRNELLKFIHDMLSAIAYLQSKRLVHGDIRSEFIYFDPEENKYVLSDRLDSLCDMNEAQFSNISLNHALYMSPLLFNQLITNNLDCVHNHYKSELFSLGMLILDIFADDDLHQSVYDKEDKFMFDTDKFTWMCDDLRHNVFKTERDTMIGGFIVEVMLELDENKRKDPITAARIFKETIWKIYKRKNSNEKQNGLGEVSVLKDRKADGNESEAIDIVLAQPEVTPKANQRSNEAERNAENQKEAAFATQIEPFLENGYGSNSNVVESTNRTPLIRSEKYANNTADSAKTLNNETSTKKESQTPKQDDCFQKNEEGENTASHSKNDAFANVNVKESINQAIPLNHASDSNHKEPQKTPDHVELVNVTDNTEELQSEIQVEHSDLLITKANTVKAMSKNEGVQLQRLKNEEQNFVNGNKSTNETTGKNKGQIHQNEAEKAQSQTNEQIKPPIHQSKDLKTVQTALVNTVDAIKETPLKLGSETDRPFNSQNEQKPTESQPANGSDSRPFEFKIDPNTDRFSSFKERSQMSYYKNINNSQIEPQTEPKTNPQIDPKTEPQSHQATSLFPQNRHPIVPEIPNKIENPLFFDKMTTPINVVPNPHISPNLGQPTFQQTTNQTIPKSEFRVILPFPIPEKKTQTTKNVIFQNYDFHNHDQIKTFQSDIGPVKQKNILCDKDNKKVVYSQTDYLLKAPFGQNVQSVLPTSPFNMPEHEKHTFVSPNFQNANVRIANQPSDSKTNNQPDCVNKDQTDKVRSLNLQSLEMPDHSHEYSSVKRVIEVNGKMLILARIENGVPIYKYIQ
jgi:hypothetical protein